MCGVLGIARAVGNRVPLTDVAVSRLRDLMSHRGPDGCGVWRREHVVLAHRRLAVIDRTGAGAQPFVSHDGRYALVYNGELYNDAELRSELAGDGWAGGFRTACDTETVLAALIHWGAAALERLRGMFALGFVDLSENRLLLARDPMGVKPLYFHLHRCESGCGEVIFASEPGAILAHPAVSVVPDLLAVSAYLSTIRTTVGNNTLFADVRTLRPGEALTADLSGRGAGRAAAGDIGISVERYGRVGRERGRGVTAGGGAGEVVRAAVEDSVRRHLRADVPACLLLSGGLDSSIIASCAAGQVAARDDLRTYCAGARGEEAEGDDFEWAAVMASHVGASHHEAAVDERLFGERWAEMVDAMGVPLGTPNEVAINHVARLLRSQGNVVALSGEGADELFGGYEEPMRLAWQFEQARRCGGGDGGGPDPGLHQLQSASWVPIEAKPAVLNESVWGGLEDDAALRGFYRAEFAAIEREVPRDDRDRPIEPLEAHLRFLRAVNLPGLLGRLDSATMLESVEGRTPFADRVIASLAESLPMRWKYQPAEGRGDEAEGRDARVGTQTNRMSASKRVLREAFASNVPESIVQRPKASFPVPFQRWMGAQAPRLRTSALARELFTKAAIERVAADPGSCWRAAWPMINLALWGERWWG
ncbi:MAG: asparagine synthase (glutamine-hydrolyzing) [Phycisphaerales bacterium]